MSMDVPVEEKPAAAVEAEAVTEVDHEVDPIDIAMAIASLIAQLPECKSITIAGLDGDAPKIVCVGMDDSEMPYDVDAEALAIAVDALNEESA